MSIQRAEDNIQYVQGTVQTFAEQSLEFLPVAFAPLGRIQPEQPTCRVIQRRAA